MNTYYVYILSNTARTLYVGVTNDLNRRMWEHKQHTTTGFTDRYDVSTLVYYEVTRDVKNAIAREKQIKGWVRAKKLALVEAMNPEWRDLSTEWE